jgi:hypothetical protein
MAEKTIAELIVEESQLLQLSLLRAARIRAEAAFAQTGGQQFGQQAGHQTYEGISGQAGRTQTETGHTDDMNAIERMKTAVARGADDNQLSSQAINATVTGIAQIAGYSLSSQMISSGVANNQLNANIVDHNHKNSNFGRAWGTVPLIVGLDAARDVAQEDEGQGDKVVATQEKSG